ncbi:Rieske 2Fe-2S domain-containing protein [Roseateles sp. NT4]|uniref:Rieske 2Fe-2S domain-containing protein n=1 Tax=Roseateles sp. NT4 TaxID=3453715 RepID=UPI003EE996B5
MAFSPAPVRSAPLPAWPDAWYVVARSSDVARGRIVDGQVAQRAYVLFRDSQGGLVALDAHCPHMGTHLRTGEVVDDGIRCALHHWTVDRDGVLQAEPGCARMRSRTWPVFERFGLVFLFAGTGTPPPRPFAELPDDHRWLPAQPLLLKADWRAMLVNGFDTQHMRAVHQRELVRPPAFSRSRDGALCMSYETRILPGGGPSSWLIQRLARGRPHITQTCHGPTMLVESRLGRFESRAVFGLITRGDSTVAYASFGAPQGGPLRWMRLWLTRALYAAFLRKDYAVVEGMRLMVDGATDPGVRGISDYLRTLPELDGDGHAG